MAVIAIDFDGTIVIGDQPIPGAREAINLWREAGHKIVIHSCNNKEWIEKVLNELDIRYDYIWQGTVNVKGTYNATKAFADIYVDDRGYRFKGDWTHEQVEVLKLLEGLDNRKW